MTKFLKVFIIFVFIGIPQCFSMSFGLQGVDVNADESEFQTDKRLAIFKGNVVISYEKGSLTSDYIEVNTATHDFKAVGNIIYKGDGNSMKAQIAHGNLKTEIIRIGPHSTNFGPWYTVGEEAKRQADKSVIITDGKISTCGNPNQKQTFHIGAETVTYQNNGKIYARNAKIYLWGVPVLPLPYVTNRIDSASDGNFKIRPGYSSTYGPFLLISRKWKVTDQLHTTAMLDLMAKKGVAIGNETNYRTKNSRTRFLAYGLRDNDIDSDRRINGQEFNGRYKTEEDRYRINFKHQSTWFDNLTVRAQADYMSDIEFNKDFFPETYDRFEQKFTYFDAEWLNDYVSISLNARPRVNDYYTVVERLPELRFDTTRLNFWDNFSYQTKNNFSSLRMAFRRTDQPLPAGVNEPTNYSSNRFDSSHFLYYDYDHNDWLKIIPRAGVRWTHYSDSSRTSLNNNALSNIIDSDDPYILPTNPVGAYDKLGGSRTRFLYELGLESSFKFYSTKSDVQNAFWNINGLRHIIEPYINWNFIPEVSTNRDQLYFFDEVDRISRQNFIRLGFNQRWQTTRQKEIYSFIRFENYFDVHFDSINRKEGFGDWGSHLELNPVDSPITFTLDTLTDLAEGRLNAVRFGTGYTVKGLHARLSYNLTENYTSRDLYSNGSELAGRSTSSSFARTFAHTENVGLDLTYQFNKRFASSLGGRYDLQRSRFIGYYGEVGYKFQCVTAAVRYENFNYGTSSDQYQITLMLYLNAFPQGKIGSSEIGKHAFQD